MLLGTRPSSSKTIASGSALSRMIDIGMILSESSRYQRGASVAVPLPLRGNAQRRARNDEKARDQARAFVLKAIPRERALRALLVPHQIRKPLEQIMRVARAGRGFRVVLHRENRPAIELDAAIGAVEQRDVGLRCALRQRLLVHGKAVVHRGDLDLAGGLVLHGMIGAVMALMHLHGLGADGEAEHLVAEANPKR